MKGEDAKDFSEYLRKGVLLVGGDEEGSIDVSDEAPVFVSIVVNVTGYGPHVGAIYAIQNEYHGSTDVALQEAYQILEDWEKDHNPDYFAELEAEHGDEASSVFTETFDGQTWELSAEGFANAIKGTDATKYINTHSSQEDTEEPGARESLVTEGGKQISAKNLKPGDFIRGERGTRRYPILSVRRVGGTLPIEVLVQSQGTWHFRPEDSIEVFPSEHEKWTPPIQQSARRALLPRRR